MTISARRGEMEDADAKVFNQTKRIYLCQYSIAGNTANIGSIKDIDDLKAGNGVFSQLGEEWFDEYWMNYGSVTMVKEGKPMKVSSIWDFLEFKGRTDLFSKVVAKGAKRRT